MSRLVEIASKRECKCFALLFYFLLVTHCLRVVFDGFMVLYQGLVAGFIERIVLQSHALSFRD
jgi:hypothetical protein